MNCQETQSMILNYLNHNLDYETNKAFIEHIRSCSDCQDELEINYIVMTGMQQLDNDEVFTVDFRKELMDDLHRQYAQIEREEDRGHSFRVLFLAFLFSGLLWMLGKALHFLL